MVEQNAQLEQQAERLSRKLSETRDNDKDVVKAGFNYNILCELHFIFLTYNDIYSAGTKDYESSCKETAA